MTDPAPTCLITGGASGIGAACARRFAAAGYRVAIGDVQLDKGRAVAAEFGTNGMFLPLDVRHEAQFESAIGEVCAGWGSLDCLVNNAAISGVFGPIATLPVAEFDYTIEVVLRSVFLGMKHAARVMQPRRQGTIVNISSTAGEIAGFSPHVYAAAKAAVTHLTRSVAIELAEDGIRVNAVCPGNIETPIHTGVTDERWVQRMEKIRLLFVDDQPIDRMGLPAEIAEAVFWLASEASSYVTGHAMAVDGGFLAGRLWRRQPPFFKEFHPARKPAG